VFWGVFLKGFIQQEIGRYTLTTKKTITEGFADIPGPKIKGKSWFLWVFAILLALVVLVIVAGIGGAIGGVLHEMFSGISASAWGTIAMLSIIPILLVGTYSSKWNVYSIFEWIMIITVAGMTVLMVYIAFIGLPLSGKYSYSFSDLFGGMLFAIPDGATLVALAVLGTIGAGIELVYYSAWLTSKGFLKHAYHAGDTPSQRNDRLKAWIKVLKFDNWIGVTATFVVSLAFFMTGALVLKTLEKVPSGVGVVAEAATIFIEILGPGFFYLFLIGAFAGLYSTALGIADGSGRMAFDIKNELCQQQGTTEGNNKVYRWAIIIIVLSWIIFYRFFSAPTVLITVGGAALSLLFPLYSVALLYLNRQVPKQHQMGIVTKIALVLCFVLFTSLWFVGKIFG
jgi:manganese transport protein